METTTLKLEIGKWYVDNVSNNAIYCVIDFDDFGMPLGFGFVNGDFFEFDESEAFNFGSATREATKEEITEAYMKYYTV